MSNALSVSIVIPTYNRPEKLTRAINSVLNQTFQDWELIVVNDHPDVDVKNAIPECTDHIYIHHEQNQGAPVARNNGIQAASGRYIALLDDDDTWEPLKLEQQINKFESLDNSFGLVYTGREVIDGDEVVNTYIPQHEGWIQDVLLHKNIIPSESPLIRKECFETVGLFDPSFESSQDLDLWIRIADQYKIAAVKESLAASYAGHGNRISANPERKYQGHKRLIEKHWPVFIEAPSALGRRYRRLGLFATQTGRNIEGVRYLSRSFRYNPLDWTISVYILLSLTPDPLRSWLFNIRSRVTS